MLKSFYNPDERQDLEYHKELLRVAEQERLALQCMRASEPQPKSPQARTSFIEHFLRLFNFKPNRSTFALKDHKKPLKIRLLLEEPETVMDNMGKNETYERLNRDCEKKILEAASTSHALKQAGLVSPAWYCCLLIRLGEFLISSGTRLKAHYSPSTTMRI